MVELHAKLGDFKGCELLLENVIKEVQQIQLLEMSLIGNAVGNAIHRCQYHLNLLQKLQCGVYSLMLTDPAEHSFVSNIAVDYPAEFIVNIIEDAKLLGFLPNRQLMNLKNEIFAFQIEPDHICNPIISEWTRHLKLDSESDFRKVRARVLKHSEKMDIDALRRAFRKTVAEETEDQKSKRLAAANFILIYSSSGIILANCLRCLLVGDDLGSDYLFLSEVNTSLSDFLLMPNTEGTEWLRMAHISFHIHCTNPQLNSSRGLQLGKNIADLQSKNGQHINALETWKLVVFENC